MYSAKLPRLISLEQEMCLVEEIQLRLPSRCLLDWQAGESSFFSLYEREYYQNKPTPLVSLAGLWCAKQAFMKAAISLGFSNFNYLSLEVCHRSTGQPMILLHDNLAQQFREQNINIEVTIAHTKTLAVAAVLLWQN